MDIIGDKKNRGFSNKTGKRQLILALTRFLILS